MRPITMILMAAGALALVACDEHEVAHADKVLTQHRIVGVSLAPPKVMIEKGGYRGGGVEEIPARARELARERALTQRDGSMDLGHPLAGLERSMIPVTDTPGSAAKVAITGRAAHQNF